MLSNYVFFQTFTIFPRDLFVLKLSGRSGDHLHIKRCSVGVGLLYVYGISRQLSCQKFAILFVFLSVMEARDTDAEKSVQKEIKEFVEKHGLSQIKEFFKTKLKGWQEVEVNIAITGNSGVGKSSFINSIRE